MQLLVGFLVKNRSDLNHLAIRYNLPDVDAGVQSR